MIYELGEAYINSVSSHKVCRCYLVGFSCSQASTNQIIQQNLCCNSKSMMKALAKLELRIGPPINQLWLLEVHVNDSLNEYIGPPKCVQYRVWSSQ